MKNLKSLKEFSKENKTSLLDSAKSKSVSGGKAVATTQTDHSNTENCDCCTTVWDDAGNMLSHTHS